MRSFLRHQYRIAFWMVLNCLALESSCREPKPHWKTLWRNGGRRLNLGRKSFELQKRGTRELAALTSRTVWKKRRASRTCLKNRCCRRSERRTNCAVAEKIHPLRRWLPLFRTSKLRAYPMNPLSLTAPRRISGLEERVGERFPRKQFSLFEPPNISPVQSALPLLGRNDAVAIGVACPGRSSKRTFSQSPLDNDTHQMVPLLNVCQRFSLSRGR